MCVLLVQSHNNLFFSGDIFRVTTVSYPPKSAVKFSVSCYGLKTYENTVILTNALLLKP